MQYFIDVANRHGTMALFGMMICMQILSSFWKPECEVIPALSEPVVLQGFAAVS